MQRIFSFLDIIYNTTDLLAEAKKIAMPGKSDNDASDDEMVKVPRARYELLIEMYATTMADVNARLLQKQIEARSSESLPSRQDGGEEKYKEKYGNLVKDEKLDLQSMRVFF